MSGRKQHFIPQLLLRQFAAVEERKTKSIRVWVHPKNRDPYLTATEGVAAQRDFYSDVRSDGIATLDDIITKYESRFAWLLRQIGGLPAGSAVNRGCAAEIVSHLVIRNAHMRHGVNTLMDGVARIAIDTFGNNEKLTKYLGLERLRPSELFDKHLQDKLDDIPSEFASLPTGLVRIMVFALMRENMGQLVNSQMTMFLQALAGFSEQMGPNVRELHNRVLLETDLEIPHGFIAKSPIEEWTTAESVHPLILPDCGAIGVKAGGQSGPLLFTGGPDLRHVILPISPSLALVGRRRDDDWPVVDSFNTSLAEASEVFFVSSIDDEYTGDLRETIGAASSSLFSELLEQTASSLEPDSTVDDVPVLNFHVRGTGDASAPTLGEYRVSYLGFPEDFPAKDVADRIGGVVFELADLFSMGRLAGVTFAHDYERALAELDRGFPASIALETVSADIGVGVFQTPLVVRGDHVKFYVIARADLAYGLADTGEPDHQQSLYLLIRALANVGYSDLVERSSPGYFLGRFEDSTEGARLEATSSALMNYFTSRLAAPVFPNSLVAQVEVLKRAANVSVAELSAAVEEHWESPNFEKVGSTVLRCAGLVLSGFADVAGTLAGQSRAYTEVPELVEILQEARLENWFVSFGRDLDNWWNVQGEWKFPDDAWRMSLHLDRIKWAFSMPFWKDEDYGWQVFVPNRPQVV
jgi:hypothetical protein